MNQEIVDIDACPTKASELISLPAIYANKMVANELVLLQESRQEFHYQKVQPGEAVLFNLYDSKLSLS